MAKKKAAKRGRPKGSKNKKTSRRKKTSARRKVRRVKRKAPVTDMRVLKGLDIETLLDLQSKVEKLIKSNRAKIRKELRAQKKVIEARIEALG